MIDQKLTQDVSFELQSMASSIKLVIDWLASHDIAESDVNKNQLKVEAGRLENIRQEMLGLSNELAKCMNA